MGLFRLLLKAINVLAYGNTGKLCLLNYRVGIIHEDLIPLDAIYSRVHP
jgi:hypothetical protein